MERASRTRRGARRRWVAVGLAALIATSTTFDAPSAAQESERPDGSLSGRAAVDSLGDEIDEVAARHNMSAEKLTDILTGDPTARLHPSGRVYFDDSFESPDHAPGTSDAWRESPVSAAFVPSDAFTLHSRPGAKRVIYLDFTGHTITNTVWNTPTFVSVRPPFSLDGNRSTFSTAERELIHEVWLRVSEDYAPFAIDVTTQDPGNAAITRSGPSDQNYGTRALISPRQIPSGSASDPVCSGCAGIAYLSVFGTTLNHAFYQPAMILSDVANDSASEIAEVVSHEVGHNLGLSHDGGGGWGEYHLGYGNWSPIMGAGYTDITQWSDGGYRGASNTESDLEVIAANGGTAVADDHGGTVGSATASGPIGSLDVAGVISSRTDVDAISFTVASSATVSISVDPADVAPGLDVRAVLRRADGTGVLANDSTDQAACLTATLPAGTYVVLVDGTGRGNPFATRQNGYTDYGSLGRYTVRSVPSCSAGPRFVSRFGQPGIDAGQLQNPVAVAAGSDGDVYVADVNNATVGRYSPSGTFRYAMDKLFFEPSGVAVGADDHVYVSDSIDSVVYSFDETGESIATIGEIGSGNGQFVAPAGVVIDPLSGELLVMDKGNDRVQRLSTSGTYVSKFGATGTADGQFTFPLAIAVDGDGGIYVTDVYYVGLNAVARLQKFSSAGVFQWSNVLTEASDTFANPSGVAVGSNGIVYVVDQDRSTIQAVTVDGDDAGSWSHVVSASWRPQDIAAGLDGDLWVPNNDSITVERYTHRVPELLAPTVSITEPVAGQKVLMGGTVRLRYTCADTGGAGIDSCRGPVATGAAVDTINSGNKALTVVAVDRDGNATYATRTLRVVPPVPDGRVRRKGATKWIGNDDYEFGSQFARASARPGRKAICQVSFQNDALVPDTLAVAMGAGAVSGYTVTVRNASGKDITKKMRNGTYRTRVLDPGATQVVSVVVAIRRSPVPTTSQFVQFSVSSANSEAGSDFVGCSVTPS